MAANPTSREFFAGWRRSIPVVLAVSPFGVLFGALAVDNGLSVGEAVLMSATIFAGASQMVGLELFGQHVAPWLIAFSILAVNFRHVLYSAAIGPLVRHWTPLQRWIGLFFLVDPQYAEAERQATLGRTITFPWFMGMGLSLYVSWTVEAAVGAYFGNLIPDPHALGIDFILPIYFLGLVMSFRGRPLWLPVVIVSAVASIVAERTVGSPWHVSIGAIAGVLLAAFMPTNSGGTKGADDANAEDIPT